MCVLKYKIEIAVLIIICVYIFLPHDGQTETKLATRGSLVYKLWPLDDNSSLMSKCVIFKKVYMMIRFGVASDISKSPP